jgi:hypothetical protein
MRRGARLAAWHASARPTGFTGTLLAGLSGTVSRVAADSPVEVANASVTPSSRESAAVGADPGKLLALSGIRPLEGPPRAHGSRPADAAVGGDNYNQRPAVARLSQCHPRVQGPSYACCPWSEMSKTIHEAAVAVTLDGTVLVSVAQFTRKKNPKKLMRLALAEEGDLFIGVAMNDVEAGLTLMRLDNAVAEAAAKVVGQRRRRGPK